MSHYFQRRQSASSFRRQFAQPSGPRMMDAKFPGTCTLCGCRFPAGTAIAYQNGKASHATEDACDAARAAKAVQPAVVAPTVNLSAVVALLNKAKEAGLQYPEVLFSTDETRFIETIKLSLASERAKVPGSVTVVVGGEWKGRVTVDGEAQGRGLVNDARLMQRLQDIAADPAKAAKVYSQLTSSCSFCQKRLTDLGSIEVGYGPKCAANYGLPHTPKGSAAARISVTAEELGSDGPEDTEPRGASADRADQYYSSILGF